MNLHARVLERVPRTQPAFGASGGMLLSPAGLELQPAKQHQDQYNNQNEAKPAADIDEFSRSFTERWRLAFKLLRTLKDHAIFVTVAIMSSNSRISFSAISNLRTSESQTFWRAIFTASVEPPMKCGLTLASVFRTSATRS
jgi:hypothetical protein